MDSRTSPSRTTTLWWIRQTSSRSCSTRSLYGAFTCLPTMWEIPSLRSCLRGTRSASTPVTIGSPSDLHPEAAGQPARVSGRQADDRAQVLRLDLSGLRREHEALGGRAGRAVEPGCFQWRATHRAQADRLYGRAASPA